MKRNIFVPTQSRITSCGWSLGSQLTGCPENNHSWPNVTQPTCRYTIAWPGPGGPVHDYTYAMSVRYAIALFPYPKTRKLATAWAAG